MKILVLGGDGYLGWPTALHLSQAGHEVAVADNFIRRHYDDELGVESLVPIEPLGDAVLAPRVLERVLNRQFHIRRSHLSDHRSVNEFHERMND